MPQLRRDGNGEAAEENIPQAGLAAICPAAIETAIARVRAPFVMLAATTDMTKPDGGALARR